MDDHKTWQEDSCGLFDVDKKWVCGWSQTPKQEFLKRLVVAFGGTSADEELIQAVVGIMYADPEVTWLCRILLGKMKMNTDRDEMVQIWASGIRRAIEEDRVHDEMWEVLWRDVSLMPRDLVKEFEVSLWSKSKRRDPIAALSFLCG
jgi:hypothetical protein